MFWYSCVTPVDEKKLLGVGALFNSASCLFLREKHLLPFEFRHPGLSWAKLSVYIAWLLILLARPQPSTAQLPSSKIPSAAPQPDHTQTSALWEEKGRDKQKRGKACSNHNRRHISRRMEHRYRFLTSLLSSTVWSCGEVRTWTHGVSRSHLQPRGYDGSIPTTELQPQPQEQKHYQQPRLGPSARLSQRYERRQRYRGPGGIGSGIQCCSGGELVRGSCDNWIPKSDVLKDLPDRWTKGEDEKYSKDAANANCIDLNSFYDKNNINKEMTREEISES